MTSQDVLSDLEHASRIAREGAETPLLGGPIGLMWGILITTTFTVQYLILEQILAVPGYYLAFLWIGFAVIGGMGVFILSRKQNQRAGAKSAANRVEAYVWTMFAAMMWTLAIGIILNIVFGGGTHGLWDIMVIIGFAGQGLAYGVVAKMSKSRWLHIAAFAAFTMSALCFAFYGQTFMYVIAAVGTVFTIILPSLKTIKVAG